MIHLNNQLVIVMGAGQSGISAARFLLKLGAQVCIVDDADLSTVKKRIEKLGGLPSKVEIAQTHHLENIALIVWSPGIPLSHPLAQHARDKKISLVSEIELAAAHLPNCRFVGITGTNGKSTTTTILGCIMSEFNPNTFVGGNLGTPLCEALANGKVPDYAIIELSSFQLELLSTLKLDAAIITNLTPDHLDRYASVEDYYRVKKSIFSLLKYDGTAIMNCGTEITQDFILSQYYIGQHNLENAAAAITAAQSLGIPHKIIQQGLDAYHGIAHRLEMLGEVAGVKWINDSKATNVESAIVAVQSFTKGIHLIVGGLGKGAPYKTLVDACQNKVKSVYVIGQDAANLLAAFQDFDSVTHSHTLAQAVSDAQANATKGDVILLAPACASYDQFESYADRGNQFRALYEAAKRAEGQS